MLRFHLHTLAEFRELGGIFWDAAKDGYRTGLTWLIGNTEQFEEIE